MIVGDLPPYEAFPIGGTNSVRGYAEGERWGVGRGRRAMRRMHAARRVHLLCRLSLPAHPFPPGCWPNLLAPHPPDSAPTPQPPPPPTPTPTLPPPPQVPWALAATLWLAARSCGCRWCRPWRPRCLPTGAPTWTVAPACWGTRQARAASQVGGARGGQAGGQAGACSAERACACVSCASRCTVW